MSLVRQFLPQLLMPSTVALLLFAAGLCLRRKMLMLVAGAIVWSASSPLVSNVLMGQLERHAPRIGAADIERADAIVVLSGSYSRVGNGLCEVELHDFDRFFGGLDLFRAGRAPRLIFTGGASDTLPDQALFGEVLRERAHEFGVPLTAISVTPRVTSTLAEAAAIASLLEVGPSGTLGRPESDAPLPTPTIILVTSAYHMARSCELFSRAGLKVVPYPVDFRSADPGLTFVGGVLPSASALQQTETAVRELYGRAYHSVF